jgi:hypothetical protein
MKKSQLTIGTLRALIREAIGVDINDEQFLSTMKDLGKIADRIKKLPRDRVEKAFNDLGPEDAPATRRWWYVLHFMAQTGSEDFLGDDVYLKGALSVWNQTTSNDKKTLVNRAVELTKEMHDTMTKQHGDRQKPEAPDTAPLQKYAFADQRPDVPDEPNTSDEEQLFADLKRHFNDNVPVDKKSSQEIKGFLNNDMYGTVFHAPDVKMVYRGMAVDEKWLKSALNVDQIEDKGERQATFTFTPREHEGASSWTLSKDVADDFAQDSSMPYSVILAANISDNPDKFVTGPDGLYDVNGLNNFTTEQEVISLGDVKVAGIKWYKS